MGTAATTRSRTHQTCPGAPVTVLATQTTGRAGLPWHHASGRLIVQIAKMVYLAAVVCSAVLRWLQSS